MGTIFIGGVHGVGKTSMCLQLAKKTGICHVTASDLIKHERANQEMAIGKKTSDVDGNQEALINGLKRLMGDDDLEHLILDGHFSIIDANGTICTINEDVFRALGIEIIILLHDDPASISERLIARDLHRYHGYDVAAHQQVETIHGQGVAEILKVPFITITAFNYQGLEDTVASVTKLYLK